MISGQNMVRPVGYSRLSTIKDYPENLQSTKPVNAFNELKLVALPMANSFPMDIYTGNLLETYSMESIKQFV